MEPATKEDVLHLEKFVDQKFELVATKKEVAEIARDVAVIREAISGVNEKISGLNEKIDSGKSDRRWLAGISLSASGVLALILGLFIKFIAS